MIAVPNISRLSTMDRTLGDVGDYLRRKGVQNANCNADGSIWIEEAGRGKYLSPHTLSEAQRQLMVSKIASETGAGPITKMNSRMSFDLQTPYHVRGQAFRDPVGPGWIVMFRNHAVTVLDDSQVVFRRTYHDRDAYPLRSSSFHDGLVEAVRRRMNILIAGAQNAGKTTLLDWVMKQFGKVRPDARLIVMQDSDELQITQADHVKLFHGVKQQRFERNGSSVAYTYEPADLITDVLRCSADAYLDGEKRSPEAVLGWVLGSNNGARGMLTTIHANSALHALYRMEQLIAASPRANFSQSARELVASSVDAVVYCEYSEETRERWVGDFQWIREVKNGEYVLQDVIQ